jgi:hypothetical protein
MVWPEKTGAAGTVMDRLFRLRVASRLAKHRPARLICIKFGRAFVTKAFDVEREVCAHA